MLDIARTSAALRAADLDRGATQLFRAIPNTYPCVHQSCRPYSVHSRLPGLPRTLLTLDLDRQSSGIGVRAHVGSSLHRPDRTLCDKLALHRRISSRHPDHPAAVEYGRSRVCKLLSSVE